MEGSDSQNDERFLWMMIRVVMRRKPIPIVITNPIRPCLKGLTSSGSSVTVGVKTLKLMIFRVRVITGVNVKSGVSVPVFVGEIRAVAVDVMVAVLVTNENGDVDVRVGVLLWVRSMVGVDGMVGVEV